MSVWVDSALWGKFAVMAAVPYVSAVVRKPSPLAGLGSHFLWQLRACR
jgi:hypothetical protein